MNGSIFDAPTPKSDCCINAAGNSFQRQPPGAFVSLSSSDPAVQQNIIGQPTAPEPDDMASLFASEMNKLSFQEREAVYEDLHAVSKPVEESSEVVDEIIRQMRDEIAGVRVKPAYNKAIFLNRKYVDDPRFLLMFLRSTRFDAREAAHKICDHFRFKLELFGPDLLAREIMYEDLDQDSREALYSGAVQVPRCKDRAGRAIIFFAFDQLRYNNVASQIRVVWYLMMCTLTDPEIQKNGIVLVSYNIQYSSSNLHLDLMLKSSLIPKAMPQKIMGIHFCYNNEIMHPLSSTLQLIVGHPARLKFRTHYGSPMEVMYSLGNFGIDMQAIPVDDNGIVKREQIASYVEERIKEDDKTKRDMGDKIMHPLCTDVLLGRGWHQQEHPGNLNLAKIVDEHRQLYKSARKRQKTNLNWRIVQIIRQGGGRFLEKSSDQGGGWVKASDESSRDKVSKCFRTQTKRSSSTFPTDDSVPSNTESTNIEPMEMPVVNAKKPKY